MFITKLDKAKPSWWKERGEDLQDAVLLPATDSVKEWADEILALDQFLVEGFLLSPLRGLTSGTGRSLDIKWGSLRVLQELLVGLGHSEESAKDLVSPLQRLHALRTEVRGHAAIEKKRAAESAARSQFGNLRTHFQQMVADCEQALNGIIEALNIKLDS